jgi:type II secretory pathway component PulF
MPQFSYRARNAQGGLVEGVLDCADRAVAIRQIEQLRYIPVRIDAVRSDRATALRPPLRLRYRRQRKS